MIQEASGAARRVRDTVGDNRAFAVFDDSASQDRQRDGTDYYATEAIKNQLQPSVVSDLFFSGANIAALHEGLRYSVFRKSDGRHVIGRQSDVDLKIMMRSAFLTHCKHLPYDVLGQVRELNAIVLEEAVRRVMSEVDMYLHYRGDVIQQRQPLERPKNVSSAGTKTLVTF